MIIGFANHREYDAEGDKRVANDLHPVVPSVDDRVHAANAGDTADLRVALVAPPMTAQCRALRSRRVIKSSELKSMECCAGDLMKTTKTLLTLRPLEQDNGLWPKTMSKA